MIDAIPSLFSTGRLERGVADGAKTFAAPSAGPDFGSALSQAALDAAHTLKTAESASLAGLEGRASAQKVVEAVLAAEQSLQTAIAIRDKLVNSYLELTRMAI